MQKFLLVNAKALVSASLVAIALVVSAVSDIAINFDHWFEVLIASGVIGGTVWATPNERSIDPDVEP